MKLGWIISFLVLFAVFTLFPVSGSAQTLWAKNGVAVSAADEYQMESDIIPDGSGGAIITWMDDRGGNFDIYAQRLDADGNSLWTADGVPVCTATNTQGGPRIASDGWGGAIITWQDNRDGDWVSMPNEWMRAAISSGP